MSAPVGTGNYHAGKAGKRIARPSRRGADKVLGDELRRRGDGRWLFDGSAWLSVADVRVKVCGPDNVPESVPGWLDIGPMSAHELAERVGFDLEAISPAITRQPRATAKPKSAPATYASIIESLLALADSAGELAEIEALSEAADALDRAMLARAA